MEDYSEIIFDYVGLINGGRNNNEIIFILQETEKLRDQLISYSENAYPERHKKVLNTLNKVISILNDSFGYSDNFLDIYNLVGAQIFELEIIAYEIDYMESKEFWDKVFSVEDNDSVNYSELDDYNDDFYDPYEDNYWGGLTGEEAYIGFWNTD